MVSLGLTAGQTILEILTWRIMAQIFSFIVEGILLVILVTGCPQKRFFFEALEVSNHIMSENENRLSFELNFLKSFFQPCMCQEEEEVAFNDTNEVVVVTRS